MLQTLELTNFRSYSNGLFGFEPGVNIIVGANASGKTNLLQAIHTICLLKGFSISDKELITHESEWSRIEAMTDEGIRVAKLQETKPKQLEIDGDVKKRLSLESEIPVVVFEPLDMLMLGSESERRRSYIDDIIAKTTPGYKALLRDYKKALAQRNRLLKQENITASQLFIWDVQLTEKAGVIAKHRYDFIKSIKDRVGETYKSIASKTDELKVGYSSKFSVAMYSSDMMGWLKENLRLDIARGFTGAGPHRDDISIDLNGYDARVNASRGETRSIILSLKVVELKTIERLLQKKPLFLLDDVFSELDGGRRKSLANTLKNYQTFITTTDADIVVEHFQKTCNIIPVSSNNITID